MVDEQTYGRVSIEGFKALASSLSASEESA